MKKFVLFAALLVLMVVFSTQKVFAGPPFNNLEGAGGVAYNPLAYLADSGEEFIKIGDTDILAKPRFGAWYVNLGEPKIDWTTFGVATTFLKRLEVSYGYETIGWSSNPTRHKNNIGAKLLVLKENFFDTKFIPAFSIGTIYKATSDKLVVSGLRSTGQDWYAVATKTIDVLPIVNKLSVPVIISGGLLSSQEYVTGVLGFHNKRKLTGFFNIDLVLPHGFVVGWEFKQGEQFTTNKNNNYWDAHLAWIPNKNFTLIAAYTDTGSYNDYASGKSLRTGLGNGFVLSTQYAF